MENSAALEALNRLMIGNNEYLKAKHGMGEVSSDLRDRLAQEGQNPYAVIITCSDSRVVPEPVSYTHLMWPSKAKRSSPRISLKVIAGAAPIRLWRGRGGKPCLSCLGK